MTINWDLLIRAIAAIETGSTGPIPGDGGRAIGPLQVHQCVVDDVNRMTGTSFTLLHMEQMIYAEFVFLHYLRYYAERLPHEPTIEDLARIWNGGPYGNVKTSTIDYGRRVAAIYASLLAKNISSTKGARP